MCAHTPENAVHNGRCLGMSRVAGVLHSSTPSHKQGMRERDFESLSRDALSIKYSASSHLSGPNLFLGAIERDAISPPLTSHLHSGVFLSPAARCTARNNATVHFCQSQHGSLTDRIELSHPFLTNVR